MKRKVTIWIRSLAVLSLIATAIETNTARTAYAGVAVLNFDNLSAGTVVTDQFAANYGIKFAVPIPGAVGASGGVSTPAVVRQVPTGKASSGSNVLDVSEPSCAQEFGCRTAMWAGFVAPQQHVSMTVGVFGNDGTQHEVDLFAYGFDGSVLANTPVKAFVKAKDGFRTPLQFNSSAHNIAYFSVFAKGTPRVGIDDVAFDLIDPATVKPAFALSDNQALGQGLIIGTSGFNGEAGFSSSENIFIIRNAKSTGKLQFSAQSEVAALSFSFDPVVADTNVKSVKLTVHIGAGAPTQDVPIKVSAAAMSPSEVAKTGGAVSIITTLQIHGRFSADIAGIQLTQGIQTAGQMQRSNPDGSPNLSAAGAPYAGVPLIANKKTVARVFAGLAYGPDTGIPNMLVQLSAYHGATLLGSMLPDDGPRTLVQHLTWVDGLWMTDPAGAFTFTLPDNWISNWPGGIEIRAHIVYPQPQGLQVPSQYLACTDQTDKMCTARQSFKLGGVSFNSITDALGGPVRITPVPLIDDQNCCTIDDFHFLESRFQRAADLLPLGYSDFIVMNPAPALDESDNISDNGVNTDNSNSQALDDVDGEYGGDPNYPWPIGFDVQSRVARGISHGTLHDDGGPVSVVTLDGRPYTSVAHELFHAFGRKHASSCPGDGSPEKGGGADAWPPDQQGYMDGIGMDLNPPGGEQVASSSGPYPLFYQNQVGFDGEQSYSKDWYDLMSYCADDSSAWTSVRGWNDMTSGFLFAPAFRRVTRHATARQMLPPVTVYRVLARVTNGNARIESVRQLLGQPTLTGTSSFHLVARSSDGSILSDVPMTEFRSHTEHGGTTYFVNADISSTDVQRLELTDGGRTLAERRRSENPPTLEITSPQAGDVLGESDNFEVRWTTSDADGDPVTLSVDISTDGGKTFHFLGRTKNQHGTRILSQYLARSDNAELRVRASDGFNETSAIVAHLKTPGNPPTVVITQPIAATGTVLRGDSSLLLAGYAFDDAQHILTDKDLTWYLGTTEMGTGKAITLANLPVGEDRVRLVAKDAYGRTSETFVTVRVVPVAPQFLTLITPSRISTAATVFRFQAASTILAALAVGNSSIRPLRTRIDPNVQRFALQIPAGNKSLKLIFQLSANGRTTSMTLRIPRR